MVIVRLGSTRCDLCGLVIARRGEPCSIPGRNPMRVHRGCYFRHEYHVEFVQRWLVTRRSRDLVWDHDNLLVQPGVFSGFRMFFGDLALESNVHAVDHARDFVRRFRTVLAGATLDPAPADQLEVCLVDAEIEVSSAAREGVRSVVARIPAE